MKSFRILWNVSLCLVMSPIQVDLCFIVPSILHISIFLEHVGTGNVVHKWEIFKILLVAPESYASSLLFCPPPPNPCLTPNRVSHSIQRSPSYFQSSVVVSKGNVADHYPLRAAPVERHPEYECIHIVWRLSSSDVSSSTVSLTYEHFNFPFL